MAAERKRVYGVYRARISGSADPLKRRRVKVVIPSVLGAKEVWAPVAGPPGRRWGLLDSGDQVLVAFEAGDPRQPYVIGFLWKGDDSPPDSAYS